MYGEDTPLMRTGRVALRHIARGAFPESVLPAAPKPEDGKPNRAELGTRQADSKVLNEPLTYSNCRAARARPFDQRIGGPHPLTTVRLSGTPK